MMMVVITMVVMLGTIIIIINIIIIIIFITSIKQTLSSVFPSLQTRSPSISLSLSPVFSFLFSRPTVVFRFSQNTHAQKKPTLSFSLFKPPFFLPC